MSVPKGRRETKGIKSKKKRRIRSKKEIKKDGRDRPAGSRNRNQSKTV